MMLWHLAPWEIGGTVCHHEANMVVSIFVRRDKGVRLFDGVFMPLPRLAISVNFV